MKVRDIFNLYFKRKRAKLEVQREVDREIIEDTINNFKYNDLLEALRETGETNEIDNQVILGEINQAGSSNRNFLNMAPQEEKGKGKRERFSEWRNHVLKKINFFIRKIYRQDEEHSDTEKSEFYSASEHNINILEDAVWGQGQTSEREAKKKITAKNIKGDAVWGEGKPLKIPFKKKITEKHIKSDEVWGKGRRIHPGNDLQNADYSEQYLEIESLKNNIGLQAYLNRIEELRHEAKKVKSSHKAREARPPRN